MTNQKKWLLRVLMFAGATFAVAQTAVARTQVQHSQNHSATVSEKQARKGQAGALLQIVRDATARF
jgi:hypothetical protein